MTYTVEGGGLNEIDFSPTTEVEEILQNIAVILSTPKCSAPLARGLGLAQRFIDKPIQAAQSILLSECIEAIGRYEPRASIRSVTFRHGERPGAFIPILEVEINGDN